MFDWMAWTGPTAIFFAAIALMLMALTVWELVAPTQPRKGFLPMSTTRGDRVFISLLLAAYLHIVWLAWHQAPPYPASGAAVVFGLVILRWG